MSAIRIPDSTEDLLDVDPSARVSGRLMQWDGNKFVGAPAASSGGDLSFVHNQMIPSASWVIVHNLGKYPSVTVVDSAGSEVEGDVKFLSINSVRLDFSAAFSGSAYLN